MEAILWAIAIGVLILLNTWLERHDITLFSFAVFCWVAFGLITRFAS